MKYRAITQSGVGSSSLLVVDHLRNPFALGLQAIVAGTVTDYNIEYTADDIQAAGYNPATGNWFSAVDAAAASGYTKFDTPCRAMRITIVAGTGSVTLTAVQPGPGA